MDAKKFKPDSLTLAGHGAVLGGKLRSAKMDAKKIKSCFTVPAYAPFFVYRVVLLQTTFGWLTWL